MKPYETRNKTDLIKCCNNGDHPKFVFFWGQTPSIDGSINKSCLSQWYYSPFSIDGINYPTAEHFMMASKARIFNDLESLNLIINTKNPGKVKRLGRLVKNFDNDIWDQHSFEIVVKANLEKFNQNESLKIFLQNTGTKILVEASPNDLIWGIGLSEHDHDADQPAKWRGENKLGFALMEARERLNTY